MNRLLAVVALVGWTLTALSSQEAPAPDATTLTVAPSDLVKYPDAKDILNPLPPPAAKSPAKAPAKSPAASLPAGPLIASTPVPAKPLPAKPQPAKPVVKPALHGWFAVWSLSGDAAGVQAWVASLVSAVPLVVPTVSETSTGWTVELGPLDAATLNAAWAVPGARPQLVRK